MRFLLIVAKKNTLSKIESLDFYFGLLGFWTFGLLDFWAFGLLGFVNINMNKPKTIICLEGVHGSGKTTLLEKFQDPKFGEVMTLREGFIQMETFMEEEDPQSMMNEMYWVLSWFRYVSDAVRSMDGTTTTTLVVDRSPFSAAVYVKGRGGAHGRADQ